MSIPGAIIPGLERIEGLLEVMGHPEQGLRYIHVAGTNGKGSTGLIIASILQELGCRVGTYSSPHLHSYTERFRINGEAIAAEELYVRLGQMGQHIEEAKDRGLESPSEFEILTALAFQFFHDKQPDFVILEVGMGGIYDTTNVVDPLVSVITGIDYDHTAYLGETLEEIAANKAGIIKRKRPLVVGPMGESARQVIYRKAAAENAPVYSYDEVRIVSQHQPDLSGHRLNIYHAGDVLANVQFSLLGLHQLANLRVALTALLILAEQMGYPISFKADTDENSAEQDRPNLIEPAVRRALARLKHPGRLEVISEAPLVIADAAHNPQGTAALAESLSAMLPGRERVLVCGWLNDKDVTHSLQSLVKGTRVCIVTRPEGARGSQWQRAADIWHQLDPHKSCCMEESISQAVDSGLQLLQEDEYLLITGSFYVLDTARRNLLE